MKETPEPIQDVSELPTQSWLFAAWMSIAPYARPAMTVIVFCAALWLLHHEFSTIKLKDVAASFRSLSTFAIMAAITLTMANYIVLIGYDWLGVRLIGHPVTNKQIVTASLLSYAFSNSLGTVLGGTPIRFRFYSAWGLSAPEIVRLIFFIGFAFWLGLLTLSGTLFVAFPFDIPARFHLPLTTSRPLGTILLMLSAALFASCVILGKPIHFLGVNFQPPRLRIAMAQAALSALDFTLAAATLYVLLPPGIAVSFLTFTAIFLLAIVIGLISHVPGGLGVFELVLVTMLPQSSHPLVASLLAFRLIYYVLPLMLAVVGISAAAISQHRRKAITAVGQAARWTSIVGPRIITGAVFVAGLILLISGSLPAAEGRMRIVRSLLPLPIVELSHFFGSVVGAMLLVLARGLQRRIDAAWMLTIILLGFGAVFSLAKGLDYEEAIMLGLLLVALIPCRAQFYRRGRVLAPSLNAGWIVAILMSIGLLAWLILFAYRHVEYQNELWWSFAYRGDAPRSLRGLVAFAVVLVLVALGRLLRPHQVPPAVATNAELEKVAAIVRGSETTAANLALLGDKRFIFSQDRKAFVMFGCEGKSWIAMGDPVGPESSADEAVWQFREACDEAGVVPVFYQVDESQLGRYIEMGLSMIKIGEDACVPLANFSLEGSSRKDLRRSIKKASEAGMRFEIVLQPEASKLLPTLKQISDAWLAEKSSAEKGFSLGYFSEAYLMRFDMALVYQHDRLIAFANIWRGANKKELSIDLMRYVPDAPHGVMEYLFTELLLWGHEQGYAWFNLGMAPLSGVDSHRLGPLWNRVSSLVFRHGEHFYNFQGLRSYKDKFDPEWFPK
ncbi:MAG: bifunctional lysylphosphatidylglycerol flippase/synthetase MprF, partial [Planctomycetales bacterium]|nr:bifunctional lysylphosphatidylglycerol flippase/synthetase MprF [Planctomycetales bacterium]